MSRGIYPIFSGKFRGTKFRVAGEMLMENMDLLDDIAVSLNVTSLREFGWNREVPEDFDQDPYEHEQEFETMATWHDPAEGRAICIVLADEINERDDAYHELIDRASVVVELRELERVLKLAVRQNLRFRLRAS